MRTLTPLFVSLRNAARLLDMKPAAFATLVKAGHLPKPRLIGRHRRWVVEELRRISMGDIAEGGGMEW